MKLRLYDRNIQNIQYIIKSNSIRKSVNSALSTTGKKSLKTTLLKRNHFSSKYFIQSVSTHIVAILTLNSTGFDEVSQAFL